MRSRLWLFGLLGVSPLFAADSAPVAKRDVADYVPSPSELAVSQSSELRELVERFSKDRAELVRFYDARNSALQLAKLKEFLTTWQERVRAIDDAKLGVEGHLDLALLTAHLRHELALTERESAREAEMAKLLPFAEPIARLQESRRFMERVAPRAAAGEIDRMKTALTAARAEFAGENRPAVSPIVAYRAARRIAELKETLADWFAFYDGYDPLFGWWVRVPYQKFGDALDEYAAFLRESLAGIEPGREEPIIGDPLGEEGLRADLERELIAYSPEELIKIAERELAWCDVEWKRAARELGFGDDWRAALESVKQKSLAPGEQPQLVRELALEAIEFVQRRDLVTVPPMAGDLWRIQMLSPEYQKVAPFFLGGEDILVAFPTDTMEHEQKLMSLRANNVHFARATVFHELVPGHRLQYFYEARYNPHRELFSTPFWVEGWSLWWEFQLWDLGFPRSAEDRIGMLFWRTHRCARIIFSLNFHLGKWTPQQCVDFLVERVGHERASAEGEVRRSFKGDYSPLYQVGYMMGALQLRALHDELVVKGGMPLKKFHDEILRGGPMPIELVRARLKGERVPRDFTPRWRFYDVR